MGLPAENVSGFWGPVTSNIDWCESNYELTFYVAEFWNTISNLAMITLSAVGAFETRRGRQFELHYVVPFVAMMAVGLGSTLFHMSLVYHMQLFDEMPMIWGMGTIVYAIHEIDKPGDRPNFLLFWLVVLCCGISSAAYLLLDNRLIFEGTYGSMVVYAIVLLGIRVYTVDRRGLSCFVLAILFYACAFVFWITDRLHCEKLRSLRDGLHPVLHPFSQLHAFWHFFVGLSAHTFLMVVLRARLSSQSKPSFLNFHLGLFPYCTSEKLSLAEHGKAL